MNSSTAAHQKWTNKKARITSLKDLKNLIDEKAGENTADLSNVGGDLYLATRQMQLQQFQELEKARSDGCSGLKQIKTTTGTLHLIDQNPICNSFQFRLMLTFKPVFHYATFFA